MPGWLFFGGVLCFVAFFVLYRYSWQEAMRMVREPREVIREHPKPVEQIERSKVDDVLESIDRILVILKELKEISSTPVAGDALAAKRGQSTLQAGIDSKSE